MPKLIPVIFTVLAILLSSCEKQEPTDDISFNEEQIESVTEKLKSSTHTAAEKTRDALDKAGEETGEALDKVKEKSAVALDSIRDTAKITKKKAEDMIQQD